MLALHTNRMSLLTSRASRGRLHSYYFWSSVCIVIIFAMLTISLLLLQISRLLHFLIVEF